MEKTQNNSMGNQSHGLIIDQTYFPSSSSHALRLCYVSSLLCYIMSVHCFVLLCQFTPLLYYASLLLCYIMSVHCFVMLCQFTALSMSNRRIRLDETFAQLPCVAYNSIWIFCPKCYQLILLKTDLVNPTKP